jgi:hypothetical protein
MFQAWVSSKRNEFIRDILRDFCMVADTLEKEFIHYKKTRLLRFDFLNTLLGREMNKGLLWRLKDTAHIFFSNEPEKTITSSYLDWAIGYIFHECMKLREDTYQMEHYASWFYSLPKRSDIDAKEKQMCDRLFPILQQTRESTEREIKRIKFIIINCRQLFIIFLAGCRENILLARFCYTDKKLIKKVFKKNYNKLFLSIYQNEPEYMFILAAQSLRSGGWIDKAQRALGEAEKINPTHKLLLQEKYILGI